jgi:hypothetical protein
MTWLLPCCTCTVKEWFMGISRWADASVGCFDGAIVRLMVVLRMWGRLGCVLQKGSLPPPCHDGHDGSLVECIDLTATQ